MTVNAVPSVRQLCEFNQAVEGRSVNDRRHPRSTEAYNFGDEMTIGARLFECITSTLKGSQCVKLLSFPRDYLVSYSYQRHAELLLGQDRALWR